MVRGAVAMVTPVAGTYQCADTQTIARGRGSSAPMRRQASVYGLVDTAFIGLPWPKKIAGRLSAMPMVAFGF
jgi:hypothetical protein